MKLLIQTLFVLISFLSFFSNTSYGQPWNLPDNRKNTRFTTDYNNISCPALLIRGFNSSLLEGGNDHGLGLKQILDKIFTNETEVADVVNLIIAEANQNLSTLSGSWGNKKNC